MPTISIITAIHPPKAQYLPQAGASILSQQLPAGWELRWIVMADGPRYRTVLNLLPRDPRVLFGHTDGHQGAGSTRNLALAAAPDGLVRILDGDDLLVPGALAADIRALQAHPEARFVCSATTNLMPDGSLDGWLDPSRGPLGRGQLWKWWTERDHVIPIHPATLTAPAELIRAVGGWAALPIMCEDIAMIIALNLYWPGYFRSRISMHYRIWDKQSTTKVRENSQRQTACRSIDQRMQALLDLGLGHMDKGLYS